MAKTESTLANGKNGIRRTLIVLALVVFFIIGWFAGVRHWYHIRAARNAVDQRESDEALVLLASADDSDPETHYLFARAYRRLGDTTNVHKHLVRAKELGFVVELLQREQWLMQAQLGQLKSSERSLQHLMRGDDPNPGEICEALVTGYLRQYRFDDAGLVIDAWQADYPDDPQPHFSLGMVWVHLQTWKKAAAEFRLVLEKDSDHHRARLELAKSLTESQQFEAAIESYKLCLKAPETAAAGKIGLARCYLPVGNPAAARKILEELLTEDANHQSARILMGELCLMEGAPKDAIKWLTPALEIAPNDPVLRHQFAVALHAVGRHDEADKHDAFVEEANAAIENAIVLMDKLREKPGGADSRYEIGATLLKYGSPNEGLMWLQSGLEVSPSHQLTHKILAEFFESKGQTELAAPHRRKIRKKSN
jgi:predicted Zn-dependent protease